MKTERMNERGIALECSTCERANRVPFKRLHRRGKCAMCKTPLPYVHHTVEIKTDEAFDNLIQQSSVPVLLELWGGTQSNGAQCCAQCEAQMPASELEVVASCAQGDYIVARVDLSVHTYLKERYNVRESPTMILFVKGIDMGRLQQRMTAAELERYIRSVMR